MTPRQQRMGVIGILIAGVGLATWMVFRAMESNITFFYGPSEVLAGEVATDRPFRLGGLVLPGSFERADGSMEARFTVTDNADGVVVVSYTGVLPDLFKEGQGVVTRGRLREDGIFVAEEVLAKHDENYMSPEVAKMLERQGHPGSDTGTGSGEI